VVFDFTADYTVDGPEQFLRDYKGYPQADALAQYEGLFGTGKVEHRCCWAHARRLGVPKAITAAAHKLARVVYGLMRWGLTWTEEAYAEQARQRSEEQLRHRAKELGYELKQVEAAPPAGPAPPAQA
jgi:hypothetical protein